MPHFVLPSLHCSRQMPLSHVQWFAQQVPLQQKLSWGLQHATPLAPGQQVLSLGQHVWWFPPPQQTSADLEQHWSPQEI